MFNDDSAWVKIPSLLMFCFCCRYLSSLNGHQPQPTCLLVDSGTHRVMGFIYPPCNMPRNSFYLSKYVRNTDNTTPAHSQSSATACFEDRQKSNQLKSDHNKKYTITNNNNISFNCI